MTSLNDVIARPTNFDVVIVGAGTSGSACAYWLAKSGWSVCLIEKKHFPREKTCGDGLTPRSVYQLAEMGLESVVAENGHKSLVCCFEQMNKLAVLGELACPEVW